MFSLTYKGKSFNQRETDSYINLGQLCSTHDKKLSHWSATKSSIAYLDAVSRVTGIAVKKLCIVQNGLATWGHPLVAIEVARWISTDFGVWANLHIAYNPSAINNPINVPDNSGFVYLAMTPKRWCKIGMSKQPYRRMSSLQVGTPLEITLVHRIFSFDCKALEKALHEYYSGYWMRGEWFDLPQECIDEFPSVANELDSMLEQTYLPTNEPSLHPIHWQGE